MADASQIETPVDADALREEVKRKYREVAVDPHGAFHFPYRAVSRTMSWI